MIARAGPLWIFRAVSALMTLALVVIGPLTRVEEKPVDGKCLHEQACGEYEGKHVTPSRNLV